MADVGYSSTACRAATGSSRAAVRRSLGLPVVWLVVLGNAAAIVWLWVHGGNLPPKTTGEAPTSVARITGLLSAYPALIQVVRPARVLSTQGFPAAC